MQPGDVFDNDTLRETFSVGNMGGMRRSLKNKVLVVVSDHTKGLYDDHWEGDVLHYTGMGKKGPQKLHGTQNQTLYESRANGVGVRLFEVFEPGRYIYAGEAELAGEPYQEEQTDSESRLRPVWMFPLRLKAGGRRPIPSVTIVRKLEAAKEITLSRHSKGDLKRLANKARRTAAKRPAMSEQFVRNPYVSAYVKAAANGYCDLCRQMAPFKKEGQAFLHCHHVLWLARGGPDIIQNAVALCPNCHERMHQLDRKADIKRLAARVAQRDPDLTVFDVFVRGRNARRSRST